MLREVYKFKRVDSEIASVASTQIDCQYLEDLNICRNTGGFHKQSKLSSGNNSEVQIGQIITRTNVAHSMIVPDDIKMQDLFATLNLDLISHNKRG